MNDVLVSKIAHLEPHQLRLAPPGVPGQCEAARLIKLLVLHQVVQQSISLLVGQYGFLPHSLIDGVFNLPHNRLEVG